MFPAGLIGAAFTTPTYAIDRIHALLVFIGECPGLKGVYSLTVLSVR
jgi:hypothetical protein